MADSNPSSPALEYDQKRSLLTCKDVCVDYRDLRALEGISGQFVEGSMTAVVGPNGGGKSTFLRALAGLQPLAAGLIEVSCARKGNLAYLPQNPDLDRTFPITVGDVVGMGLCAHVGFYSSFSKQDLQQINQVLCNVGLEGFIDRPIHCLSGGQFQRVLFARIALQDASIILLDEPFAAIDASTMDILMDLLQAWQSQGKTIITVLHDMDIVRDYFPETLVLARSIIAWGATAEVLNQENLRQAKVCCRSWEAISEVDTVKKRKLKPVVAGA